MAASARPPWLWIQDALVVGEHVSWIDEERVGLVLLMRLGPVDQTAGDYLVELGALRIGEFHVIGIVVADEIIAGGRGSPDEEVVGEFVGIAALGTAPPPTMRNTWSCPICSRMLQTRSEELGRGMPLTYKFEGRDGARPGPGAGPPGHSCGSEPGRRDDNELADLVRDRRTTAGTRSTVSRRKREECGA